MPMHLKPTQVLRLQVCWIKYDYLNQDHFLDICGHPRLLGAPYLDCSDHLTCIQLAKNAEFWILVATQLALISYQCHILDCSGITFCELVPFSFLMAFFNFLTPDEKLVKKHKPNLNILLLYWSMHVTKWFFLIKIKIACNLSVSFFYYVVISRILCFHKLEDNTCFTFSRKIHKDFF